MQREQREKHNTICTERKGGNMNTYKKYCPCVYVAECDEPHEKGDVIPVTTHYGKDNNCIILWG